MSNDQPARRPPAKSSGGGAPMGSTISIVVAVVAVVVGFLILRNINDDSSSDASDGIDTPSTNSPDGTTNPADSTSTSSTLPAPSTTAALVTTGATVVVANASGVPGAAATMTTSLQAAGFTTGTPTNAVGTESRIDVSKVYYIDDGTGAALAVANSVAQAMNGVVVATMPTPVPIEGDTEGLGGATVLLMLGKDYGGKPLPILAPETTVAVTSPIATIATTTTVG